MVAKKYFNKEKEVKGSVKCPREVKKVKDPLY